MNKGKDRTEAPPEKTRRTLADQVWKIAERIHLAELDLKRPARLIHAHMLGLAREHIRNAVDLLTDLSEEIAEGRAQLTRELPGETQEALPLLDAIEPQQERLYLVTLGGAPIPQYAKSGSSAEEVEQYFRARYGPEDVDIKVEEDKNRYTEANTAIQNGSVIILKSLYQEHPGPNKSKARKKGKGNGTPMATTSETVQDVHLQATAGEVTETGPAG